MGRLEKRAKKGREEAYAQSSGRTKVFLSMLKSYAKERKRTSAGKKVRPKRNPMNTGTLGRFARSGM